MTLYQWLCVLGIPGMLAGLVSAGETEPGYEAGRTGNAEGPALVGV